MRNLSRDVIWKRGNSGLSGIVGYKGAVHIGIEEADELTAEYDGEERGVKTSREATETAFSVSTRGCYCQRFRITVNDRWICCMRYCHLWTQYVVSD